MNNKNFFDRVITEQPKRKKSGRDRIRDDEHYARGERRASQSSDQCFKCKDVGHW
jgi:hypothetical protein